MIDLTKTCRTCMKRDVSLVDLFGPLKIENNSALKLADVLMETTPLQIAREDGLPQKLCDECEKTLQLMHIFRNQALYSENQLKKIIISTAKIKNENIEYNFKNEVEYTDEFDEFIPNDNLILEESENGGAKYTCVICKKEYSNYDKYLKHQSVHEKQEKSCPKCHAKFYKKSLLREHMNEHCQKSDFLDTDTEDFNIKVKLEDEECQCSICFMQFESQKYLKSHLKQRHNLEEKLIETIQASNNTLDEFDSDIKLEISNEQYKCTECNLVFEKYRSLISHSKKHKNLQTELFKCNYCNRGFSSKGPLKRHLLLHSEEKPFQCTECTKCYVRRDALVAHMRKHSGVKKYTCEHCNKAFNQLCTLKDHIRTHTGESPFLCSECGKGFKNSSNLRQHLARHSGIKPFACNLCPKTFSTKGQMKCHMVSHTGDHPYKCDKCDATFTRANSLKKHNLIHLGIKPYACDNCNMRFMVKDRLKRHQRTHTGEKPYRCQHCARAFTQSNDLAKHVRVHVGQNIYQCSVCQAKFRLMKELRLHYPIHYTEGEAPILDKSMVVLNGCTDNIDNINKPTTDGQITITFNRNILDKNSSGDITINIGPEKID